MIKARWYEVLLTKIGRVFYNIFKCKKYVRKCVVCNRKIKLYIPKEEYKAFLSIPLYHGCRCGNTTLFDPASSENGELADEPCCSA